MVKDNQTRREYLTNRVISGIFIAKINSQLFFVKSPTRTHKYLAHMKYMDAIDDFTFESCPSKDNILSLLIHYDIVPPDVDEKIKKLEKDIDLLKHQLYLNFLRNPTKIKSLKEALKITRQMYLTYLNARHSFDHLTKEGYAESVRINWLFSSCLYDEQDNLVTDASLLERVMVQMNNERITVEEFRELARTEPWRSYWNANSDFVFGTPVVDWTDEQKTLVLYSRMYDSAYKSPETPPDLVINDDDLFDGWMIEQKKEYERGKKNKKVDRGGEKFANADEIYTMVTQEYKDAKGKYVKAETSKEAISEVEDMNSFEAVMIKKQRSAALKQKGKVAEQDMPDVKRDLALMANKQFAERFKKGK